MSQSPTNEALQRDPAQPEEPPREAGQREPVELEGNGAPTLLDELFAHGILIKTGVQGYTGVARCSKASSMPSMR